MVGRGLEVADCISTVGKRSSANEIGDDCSLSSRCEVDLVDTADVESGSLKVSGDGQLWQSGADERELHDGARYSDKTLMLALVRRGRGLIIGT